ncbi:hypothetical protein IAT40_001151 [Kwoniella sp. CBS 6097]
MASSSRLTASLAGQRRPRPHSYTPQACERCRSRKQRCVLSDAKADVCRNCVESKSICVFSRPQEKSKRSRGSSQTSPDIQDFDALETSDESTNIGGHTRSSQAIPVPSQKSVEDTTAFDSFSPTFLFPGSGTSTPAEQPAYPFSAPSLSRSIPPLVQQSDFDWQAWLTNIGNQYRSGLGSQQQAQQPQQWHQQQQQQHQPSQASGQSASTRQTQASSDLLTTFGQYQPQTIPIIQTTNTSQTNGALTNQPEAVEPAPISPSARAKTPHRSAVYPGSLVTSEDDSMEEAAKGLAMISLEASAEPHYIGESAGSLWTSIIGRGLSTHPHSPVDGNKRHIFRPNEISTMPVSTSIGGALDQALHRAIQQPLTSDSATTILETVFRHVHPRYPFLDWLSFEKQWEQRNGVLLAVGQKSRMDRESSTAAFFILMVLAVGSQLCKERTLPGVLRPEDYYNLAQPYLNTIVTLHNLANIQEDDGADLPRCIGMGLHRRAAGRAVKSLTRYEIELRKRVFWSCYTLDRMIALLLGRPPGISDDDFDVELPDVFEPTSNEIPSMMSMRHSSMVSAIHHIKLKRIESQIQRSVYSIRRRSQPNDYWHLLNLLDDWESAIPVEASAADYWKYPCCSRDWFLLKGVEARLHLLRPLCAEDSTNGDLFISLLAKQAARGCEIQKRMHQQGQPMSNASVHSVFICGLALLYAIFLRPAIMPLRDVFRGIKAASNTLFAYAQHARSAEVLYDVFEELSAACIEHVGKRDVQAGATNAAQNQPLVDEWQKASSVATSNLDPSTAGEYVNILQTLGLSVGDDSLGEASYAEPLWELATFSPGNLFPSQLSQNFNAQ